MGLGTILPGPLNNGLGSIGQPFWTIEPHAALSYLGEGWNLTATAIYGITTRNPDSGVTNGHTLNLDLTATRRFGQLELGPIGFSTRRSRPTADAKPFMDPASAPMAPRPP